MCPEYTVAFFSFNIVLVHYFIFYSLWGEGLLCHSAFVEVRGELAENGSLLPCVTLRLKLEVSGSEASTLID